jgi:hypothetical protein
LRPLHDIAEGWLVARLPINYQTGMHNLWQAHSSSYSIWFLHSTARLVSCSTLQAEVKILEKK